MASLSFLSFLLPVEEWLHMSISTTVITVKTNTLATSSRRNNRRRSQLHGSSRTSRQIATSQRATSQDSSRLQKTSITKMSLLITNLSESIHQGDTGVTGKQLGMKRLKLITKSSQKVIGLTKLKCSHLISAGLTSGRR
jgi:hypothetical protein